VAIAGAICTAFNLVCARLRGLPHWLGYISTVQAAHLKAQLSQVALRNIAAGDVLGASAGFLVSHQSCGPLDRFSVDEQKKCHPKVASGRWCPIIGAGQWLAAQNAV
jgi:hypothetical protein